MPTPAPGKICGSCGAQGQDGAFCDECGETLPTAPASPSTSQARALIVPVDEPEASGSGSVAPVLPDRPDPAMPSVVRMHEADSFEGGLRCPWCATQNPADRHFCRRCAMSMAEGPARAVRRPWWRRLFDWRGRELPYAGSRPRLRRGPGQLVRWVVTLAIIAAVAGIAATWGGTAVAAVEDHFAKPVFTPATTVTASSSDPAHPVERIDDGYNNTWWGDGQTGDGAHVDATFANPINLLDVVITPGAGTAKDVFATQSRPQSLNVTLTGEDGHSTTTMISLPNSPGPQTFAIRGNDIRQIRFTIESAYPGSASHPEVAITEIEFFEKT